MKNNEAKEAPATPEEQILNEQIRIEILRNPEQAKSMIDKLIRDNRNNPAAMVRALLFKGHLRVLDGDSEGQRELAEEALELSRKHSLAIGEADSLRILGGYHIDHHDVVPVFKCLTRSLELSIANDHARQTANAHNSLGIVHAVIADYEQAVKHLRASAQLLETLGADDDLTQTYFNLATLYSEVDQLDTAAEYLTKSIECCERDSNDIDLASALGSLGQIFLDQGEFEKVVDVCKRSLQIGEKFPNDRHAAYARARLVHAYMELNNRTLAEEYMSMVQKELGKNSEETRIDDLWMLYGTALVKLGHKKDAIEFLQRAAGLYREGTNQNVIENIHKSLAELYAEAHDMERALHHQQVLSELREAHRNRLVRQAMDNANTRMDLINAEKEARTDIEFDSLQRQSLVGRLVRSQARSNLQIKSIHAELENELPQIRGQARRIANETLELIRRAMSENQDMPQIDSLMAQEHGDFLARLTQHCPALTPTEVRICILISHKLRSKEIADNMFVTLDTIKSHRKNIRAKLQLPDGSNLTDFLIGLMTPVERA